jgi:hypothetical protein
MGLILSNCLIKEKNERIYKALSERLYIVKFLYNININFSLFKEEPNIIIFCNKLYFSYTNRKQKRVYEPNKKNQCIG